MGWSGLTLREGGDSTTNDLFVAAKFRLPKASGGPFDLTVIAGTSVPVGEGSAADDTAPTGGLICTRTLGASTSLFGTGTVTLERVFTDATVRFTNALGVAHTVGGGWGVFAEHFVVAGEQSRTSHTVDFGVTWLAGPQLQLEVNAAVGLAGDAPDGFLGAGIAYRW